MEKVKKLKVEEANKFSLTRNEIAIISTNLRENVAGIKKELFRAIMPFIKKLELEQQTTEDMIKVVREQYRKEKGNTEVKEDGIEYFTVKAQEKINIEMNEISKLTVDFEGVISSKLADNLPQACNVSYYLLTGKYIND